MIKIYQKTVKNPQLKTRSKFEPGSWIYVENPTPEELRSLEKDYSLDLGLLKDAIDPFEMPRMEIEDDVTYVYTRVPYEEGKARIETVPVMIGIGSDFLITVSREPLPLFKKFSEEKINFYTTQKTKLLLQIFSQINGTYNAFLTGINRRVQQISVRPERVGDKEILQFVTFEETLNAFVSDLVPTSSILKNLLSGKLLRLFEEDKDLVEDILLSTEQLVETSKSNLKTIVNIREAYSAIMTNKLNRVIKILTVLTILLTVPTIIASLYGMNITLPLAQSPLAFWGILSAIGTITAVLLLIFIKSDWL